MDANDGLWIVWRAWWFIFVQVYSLVGFGMEWNWFGSEEHQIGFSALERSNSAPESSTLGLLGVWPGLKVRTLLLRVRTLD